MRRLIPLRTIRDHRSRLQRSPTVGGIGDPATCPTKALKKYISASVLTFLVLNADAATVGGIELPKMRDGLHLNGAGLLRKGFFFKIYVGALYIDKAYDGERTLDSVAKRIDIHYFHNTPKKHMIRVANETLRKNLSAQEYKNLLPKIEKLHNAYVDGKKGSYASIIHRPGKGFTYLFDGEAIVTIDSDRFANAYFSIWIGEHTSSETVKEAMLKGAKG